MQEGPSGSTESLDGEGLGDMRRPIRAQRLNRLTPQSAATKTKLGRHADGGNLYLTISKTSRGALSKRWTFMYIIAGKQREAGFGSALEVTIEEAREKATNFRSLLNRGIDPLGEKSN
jgi:hypothetical protein